MKAHKIIADPDTKPSAALVAIIALDGVSVTVHYRRQGNTGSIATRWYSRDLLRGLPASLPVLRFDLAKGYFPLSCPFLNGDYQAPTMFDHDIRDTAAWVGFYASAGVPVQTASETLREGI
jgi:hypothetical protein